MACELQYTVELTLKCQTEEPITFSDADVPGAGAAAFHKLMANEDLDINLGDDGTGVNGYIIPFSSVVMARISTACAEIDPPADETCPVEEP